MACPARSSVWAQAIRVLCLCTIVAEAFSWGASQEQKVLKEPIIGLAARLQPIRDRAQSPNIFAVALHELRELETEPLCHRIAARLLVNNCQLLDGQDEATVLTDSGRAARDFVDFYAASLAICDLERGSFLIPAVCSKFRETVLAGIPIPSQPRLHVSSLEIDSCLEGLARSDSAWNTWVSYRHKALRFCDAARADNEKDQNIHLFQKITKVLDKLTNQVEADLDTHFQALDKMFRETSSNVETMVPQIALMKAGLHELEQMITETALRGTQTSVSLKTGLDDAQSLEEVLKKLVSTALGGNDRIVRSHESALKAFHGRLNDDVEAVMTTLKVALTASSGLQDILAHSQSRAVEIAKEQQKIEADMRKLAEIAGDLNVKQENHEERLEQAQRKAMQVLTTLESVSASAGNFKESFFRGSSLSKWWPYVFCPLTSLVVGSYGLPPSAVRNIALVGMGEIFGFIVFALKQNGLDSSSNSSTTIEQTRIPERTSQAESPTADSFAWSSAPKHSDNI